MMKFVLLIMLGYLFLTTAEESEPQADVADIADPVVRMAVMETLSEVKKTLLDFIGTFGKDMKTYLKPSKQTLDKVREGIVAVEEKAKVELGKILATVGQNVQNPQPQ